MSNSHVRSAKNGNLDQALTLLVHNQAALVAQHTSFLTELRELAVDTSRRFARIEDDLEQIKAILVRHEQMLADLPEAIRQKIGFKGK